MPPTRFRYYGRLNARQKRIYDRSDGVPSVRLPAALPLRDAAERLAAVLESDDRAATEARAQLLVDGVLHRLHVMPVDVKVLAVRPSTSREELHGLYEFGGRRQRPLISVWMRTAQKRRVVAFRTFLRTLLHEVVHHLDYQYLKLEDSFHTQGFYKRAESLYRQVAPPEPLPGGDAGSAAAPAPRPAGVPPPAAPAPRPRSRRPAPAATPGAARAPQIPRRRSPGRPAAQAELPFPEGDASPG